MEEGMCEDRSILLQDAWPWSGGRHGGGQGGRRGGLEGHQFIFSPQDIVHNWPGLCFRFNDILIRILDCEAKIVLDFQSSTGVRSRC